MNELDYGSQEACQKLFEKGIVLETYSYWFGDGVNFCIDVKGKDYIRGFYGYGGKNDSCIPAPSMAEAWRELPTQTIMRKFTTTWVWIPGKEGSSFHNENPTDALIELIIWLTEQEKEKPCTK